MHRIQNLHKASILVTGATGFLGAFVAARLAQLGHDVLCLVRAVDVDAAHGRLWRAWRGYRLDQGSMSDLPQCVRVLPSGGTTLKGLRHVPVNHSHPTFWSTQFHLL